MPTQILGNLGSPQPDNTLLPLANAKLYLVPSDATQLRIQYGGAGDFQLVTANTALPAAYQYGFVTTTDSNGQYDFNIPLDTEIHTPDPANFLWNLVLPDGSVFAGPALATAGPLNIDDLLTSHGWTLKSSLQVRTSLLGQVAIQSVAFTGQTSATVSFTGPPMPDAGYAVVCEFTADSISGAIPTYEAASRTGAGFELRVSFAYTGTARFIAWHP